MRWQYLSQAIPESLTDLQSILLANRQIESVEEFFAPKDPLTFSPKDVGIDPKQIAKAVKRLAIARDQKQDVLLFGDYDADGVCATAVLWEALRDFGILARPFIPHREKHGYGLSLRSLAAVLEEKKPDLLITVDNGVVAHEAFAELVKLGVDTILTDHHQPEVKDGQVIFPPAQVVIHTPQLCGTTTAWFLAKALSEKAAAKSLDLTAIATIADQMQLLKANRSFVVFGLEALRRTQRVGLQQLFEVAHLEKTELDVSSINYGIGPRLNAMGRLKHGLDALRLLCTTKSDRAALLVSELNQTNINRQELTTDLLNDALSQAAKWQDEHLIIVSSTSYHEGVIGLIAGKLVEMYSKPAIVIAVGETMAKASARSILGINIVELIRIQRHHLLEVGGHPMAAGFGLLPEKLPEFAAALLVTAKESIAVEQLVPTLTIDSALPPHLLTQNTAELLNTFSPFGQANPEPIFAFSDLVLKQKSIIGKTQNHLRLTLQTPDSHTITALAWNKADRAPDFPLNQPLTIAGQLQLNHWQGRTSLQIMIKDLVI